LINENSRPEIDRGTLRNIFLVSLQSETIVWDSHFISMEIHNKGWLLHFKNGTSALIKNNYRNGLKRNIPNGALFGTKYSKMRQRRLFHVQFIACH